MILQLKQMFAIRARNKITERCGELVDICILASRLHFWILSRVYFHGWKEKIHAREGYNGGDKGREGRLIVVRNLNLMVSCLFQSKGIGYSQAPVTYFSRINCLWKMLLIILISSVERIF